MNDFFVNLALSGITFLNILSIISIILGVLIPFIVLFFYKKIDLFAKLIGSFFILSLAFAADNWFVYTISLIIIATLVTELEFLEKLMALLWNREKYWEYLLKKLQTEQGGAFTPTSVEDKTAEATTNVARNNLLRDITIQAHFEKTYRLIFGSQLRVLTLLKNNPQVSREQIEAIYNTTIHVGVYSLDLFIGFLENSQLIKKNNDNTFSLNPLGSLFLDYLVANNMTLNKNF